MRTFYLIPALVALGTALCAAAPADDEKEILNFRLTMPLANKIIAAVPGVTQIFLSVPDWKERMQKSAHASLAERTKEAENSPRTVALLKQNGLTPNEYVIGVVTLRMALIAANSKSGAMPSSIRASAENIAFAKAHYAELKPKMDAADGLPSRTPK
jgi:hypothetical protein